MMIMMMMSNYRTGLPHQTTVV